MQALAGWESLLPLPRYCRCPVVGDLHLHPVPAFWWVSFSLTWRWFIRCSAVDGCPTDVREVIRSGW